MEDIQSKIRKYIIKSCPVGETKDVFVGKPSIFKKNQMLHNILKIWPNFFPVSTQMNLKFLQ